MLNLVAERNVVIPKTKVFMTYAKDSYEKMKIKLVDLLAKHPYLCQSYLGMTIHFLNENYERESYVLAFREINNNKRLMFWQRR